MFHVHRRLQAAMTGTIIITAVHLGWVDSDSATGGSSRPPGSVGRLLITNLMSRDYMMYGTEALHYSEACAAVGALRFARETGDDETISRLIKRYESLLDDSSGLISRRPHVDMAVVGIVPLEIAMISGDQRYLDQGLSFADAQWESPREDGLTNQTRWWIDDSYMVSMLQIQAYRATREPKYADRAAVQMVAYLDSLQKDSGLFYHAPEAPFFWGRGNGWVASAMAEVLSSLPENHALRSGILAHFQKMMQALLDFQSSEGMWRQVIDCPGAWAETSCTAMFANAMAVGIRCGWLNEAMYKPAVEKAWKALEEKIDTDGNLCEICVGTGQQNNLEYYLGRPRQCGDFHGQAPVLWLATELLRN